jgi:hypothetical protein
MPSPVCLSEHLSIHPVELGVTVPHVITKIQERIVIDDERLLVVVDSINRVVDMSQADSSEHGYWAAMRIWQEWLRKCSLLSEGNIGSVVVSELNAGGHIKGRSLEYAADLCIRIRPTKDQAGVYDIDAPYARASAGGVVGPFCLQWQQGSFDYVGDESEH